MEAIIAVTNSGQRPPPPAVRAKGGRFVAREMLLCLFFFGLIFDSGGELGIRVLAISMLAIMTAFNIRRFSVDANELVVWAAAMLLILPSIAVAFLRSVDLTNVILWTFPVLSFPVLLGTVRANQISPRHFLYGGVAFAVTVLMLFFGRVNQIPEIVNVHDFLAERSAGFFNEKKVFLEEALPVVYFQGTLVLVNCAILAISRGRYVAYLVLLVALAVAPSRFGVVLSLTFGMSAWWLRRPRNAFAWTALVIGLCVAGLAASALPETFTEIFSGESEGSQTRLKHLDSVVSVIDQQPWTIFTGSGPGTKFYTTGFDELTDNIEISQLEAIRKFGLPWFMALTTGLAVVCIRLIKRRQHGLALSIVAHYTVSASNPVLFSLPAAFLLAIALRSLKTPSVEK
jgi:hypothetical protein